MRNCVGSWYCCDTYYGVRAAGDRDVWLGRPVVLCVETRRYAAVLWYDERPLVAGVPFSMAPNRHYFNLRLVIWHLR